MTTAKLEHPLDKVFQQPLNENTQLLNDILIEAERIHLQLYNVNKNLAVIAQVMIKCTEGKVIIPAMNIKPKKGK